MKTIQHPVVFQSAYPIEQIAPLDSLLFFDIETTGFSGDTSSLYLIGCIFYDKTAGNWQMIQWFADTPDSEPDMLAAFFTLLKPGSTLVHFNGDMFDIPYLLKRCGRYHLPYSFSQITSVDIYRKIRPYKKLLGLDSLKQKSIEQFLGICRTDRCSGGQLIQVYEDYLVSRDRFLYDMLILHNEEDLKGMSLILPILSYPDMMEQEFRLVSQSLLRQEYDKASSILHQSLSGAPAIPHQENASSLPAAADGPEHSSASSSAPVLELVYEAGCSVPISLPIIGSFGTLRLHDSHITCRIPLYEGELKYFYPNYKDYYYLPLEDTAIHKSVGEYVAREARQKATAKTCYTRKSGLFLPQSPSSPLWQPAFRKEYKDKASYAVYAEALLSDSAAANAYLRQLLSCYLS